MFGSNYLHIRNTYALNLLDYGIKAGEHRHLKFRSTVLDNIIFASSAVSDCYNVDVSKKLFYKTINAEFELYHVRSKMQYNDFYNATNISESWKFTTFYYFIFFCNVALHRLLNKGFIYLDVDSADRFSNTLNVFLNDVVSIGKGNWSFRKLSETSTNVTLEIKKVGGNIHQLAWQDLKLTFKNFISTSSGKLSDPERVVLDNIYNFIKRNKNFSPSETRNFLNYGSVVAVDELERKIFCPQIKSENFIKTLTQLNYTNNVSSEITLSIIIGQYIFLLNSTIINDLQKRDNKQYKLSKKVK